MRLLRLGPDDAGESEDAASRTEEGFARERTRFATGPSSASPRSVSPRSGRVCLLRVEEPEAGDREREKTVEDESIP